MPEPRPPPRVANLHLPRTRVDEAHGHRLPSSRLQESFLVGTRASWRRDRFCRFRRLSFFGRSLCSDAILHPTESARTLRLRADRAVTTDCPRNWYASQEAWKHRSYGGKLRGRRSKRHRPPPPMNDRTERDAWPFPHVVNWSLVSFRVVSRSSSGLRSN